MHSYLFIPLNKSMYKLYFTDEETRLPTSLESQSSLENSLEPTTKKAKRKKH